MANTSNFTVEMPTASIKVLQNWSTPLSNIVWIKFLTVVEKEKR
jgi:hypothetical protein